METFSRAPALVPALCFLAGLAAAPRAPAPVGLLALLLLLATALGGRAGLGLAAAALGGLLGTIGPVARPPFGADGDLRLVTVAGRVCDHPVDYGESSSVELCADLLRRERVVVAGRWGLRLDLPAGAEPPPLGSRVRATGLLGRSPGFDNAHRSPPGAWSVRLKSARFLELERAPAAPWRWATGARRGLARVWAGMGGERPGAALGRALLLGDARALPAHWRRALRRCGLAHLTAVSGFNVAVVAGFAAAAGAFAPRALRLTGAAGAACAYLAVVGPAPALLRATLMALAAAAGLLAGRAPLALQALALAAAGMAARDPGVLDDVGFRLSVAATAGLIGLAERLRRRLEPSCRPLLARALGASLAAQVAAAPASVRAFGRAAPAAPGLDLLFVPATAVALGTALAASALGALGVPRLAAPALALLDLIALGFEGLARLPPSPLLSIYLPATWLAGFAAAATWLAVAWGRSARRAVGLAALALACPGHGGAGPPGIELVVADVGQGDALLLRAGARALLIDGGGARGRDLASHVLLPLLGARGIGRLDAIVLSHLDADHCAGLVDLSGYLPVGELWLPAGVRPTPCLRELIGALGAPVRWLGAGDRPRLGDLDIEVLHPEREAAAPAGNAASLVLRIEAGRRTLLLTGDLEPAAERALVRRAPERLRCDLLKVAHHGAAGSSGAEFLAAARPRLALVSAGVRNPYGHPAAASLARLARAGARVLRTDRVGGVAVAWRAGGPWRLATPGAPRRAAPPSDR